MYLHISEGAHQFCCKPLMYNYKSSLTKVLGFWHWAHLQDGNIKTNICVYVCVSQGAFWGLMTGLVVGLIRMVLEFSYIAPSCGQPDHRPAILANVHYLYFALILLALTCLIVVGVSLTTTPIPKEHVRNMSYIHYLSLLIFKLRNTCTEGQRHLQWYSVICIAHELKVRM